MLVGAALIVLGLALVFFGVFRLSPAWPLCRFIAWRIATRVRATPLYFEAEGCRLYYEVHGQGQAVLLLHGGLTSVEAWFGQLPILVRKFRVIAVDLRGHGRSTLGTEAFTYRLFASDILQLLRALSIDSTHVVGWSDGGNVGLILASQHPARVKSLVTLGANYHPDGLTADTRDKIQMDTHEQQSIISRLLYRCIAPEPRGWELLCNRVTTMWLNYPQLDTQTLAQIRCPALILQGEYDSVDIAHSTEMAAAIPQGTLDVLPGLGHNLLFQSPDLLTSKIVDFLEKVDAQACGSVTMKEPGTK